MIGSMKICANHLFNSRLLNAYPSLESILSSHIQGEHTLDWGDMGGKHSPQPECMPPPHQAVK